MIKVKNLTEFLNTYSFKDILFKHHLYYFLVVGVNTEDTLIESIISGKHPDWKPTNQKAVEWMRRINDTNILDLTPLTAEAINAELGILFDEVGELPIIRRNTTSIRVHYVKDLLEKAGIKQQDDKPICEMTLVELFGNLEHVTRKGCATYSGGWDGKYDSEGELVIE